MVRPSDGGGYSYTSVDPGQIRKFAELLDGVTEEVSTGPKRWVDTAPTGNEMFGAFNDASTRAQTKHDEMVTDSRTFWKTMHERLDNVAAGTHEIATQYADLAELNESTGSDIQAALAAGAKKA
jgi:hypothetical protein